MLPGKRSGVLTLRTIGRAFWIGLAISLVLHVFLLVGGRFQIPQWGDEPTLEARLEPEEFKAVPPPQPTAGKPTPPSRPQPRPQLSPPLSEPLPVAPVVHEPPAGKTVTPSPPANTEPVLPLSTAATPPPAAQPYAALTGAAQSIRQLPADIEIVYELKGLLSGRQTHVWHREGQRYTLETVGEVTGLAGLFMTGKMLQKSSGTIGPLGLMPEQFEMQRLSGKKETLRFDYDANTIQSIRTDKHGERTLELPLLPGAQDPLSSIYQLAMAAQNDKDGFIVTASAKRINGYPYHTIGMETLRTAFGEIKALRVVRAGDSEKSGTQMWLAKDRFWLPVKVTYVDDDGTEWVLEAVSITDR